MMPPGRYPHRVTLERLTEAADAGGDFGGGGAGGVTWAAIETFWASVEPLSGREFMEARQVSANITHRVRRRYRTGITPSDRFTFNGRTFNITEPPMNIGERNRELEIICKEVV